MLTMFLAKTEKHLVKQGSEDQRLQGQKAQCIISRVLCCLSVPSG